MERYYSLDISTKTKVVGSAPNGPLELNEPMNIRSLLEQGKLPKYAEFRLKGNARLTDYTFCMDAGTWNFYIVSPKLHSILEQFNLQNHLWSECRIVRKDKIWDYYMLTLQQAETDDGYPALFYPEMIDFNNSVFCESSFARFSLDGTEPILEVSDYNDYLAMQQKYRKSVLKTPRFVKLAFNDEYLERNKIDMCWQFPLYDCPMISERLKTTLEENDITGIELIDINSCPTREVNLWD